MAKVNAGRTCTTSYGNLYSTPAGSVAEITFLLACNKTSTDRSLDVQWRDNSSSNAAYQLVDGVTIPGNQTLVLPIGIVLEASDQIRVLASAGSAIDVSAGVDVN